MSYGAFFSIDQYTKPNCQFRKLNCGHQFQRYIGRDQSMNDDDIQFFNLYELWCLFLHRSVHKTKLSVLDMISDIIYGEKQELTKELLSRFGYDESLSKVMLTYLRWKIHNGYARRSMAGKQLKYNIKCDQKNTTL